MSVEGIVKKFPSYFENFVFPDVEPDGELSVYRACFKGKIDNEAFWGTYKAHITGYKVRRGINMKNCQSYSTSCYVDVKDIKDVLKIIQNPKTTGDESNRIIIAKGITSEKCGIAIITKKWNDKYINSHVDWWLYEDSNPEFYFQEVTI